MTEKLTWEAVKEAIVGMSEEERVALKAFIDQLSVTQKQLDPASIARLIQSRRDQAIEALRHLAKPLPPGYKFNREELNER